MELLLNHPDLAFSWQPYVFHLGKRNYAFGGTTAVYSRGNRPRNEAIPSTVAFIISFPPNTSGKVYDEVAKCIRKQEAKDLEIAVIYNEPRKNETLVVKPEFKEVHDLFVKQNQEINDLVASSSKLVELLGCKVGESKYLRDLPAEWFEMVTAIQYTPISIRCHDKTDFYQFMLKNGILERVFPKWYREGNY